jgi:hypothetical protein
VSSLVYPANLPGLTFGRSRAPIYNTGLQSRVSGKESRLAYRAYPTFRFELKYEWLDDRIATSHLKALQGLFMAMKGRWDSFLFTDRDFNAAAAFQFGTGDGVRTTWPIVVRHQNAGGPGGDELVQNFNGTPQVFANGSLQTGGGVNYTLGPTGLVTFNSPPTNGHGLTWTGAYYYRCRFADDSMTFEEFMRQWWQTRSVVFQSFHL